MEVGPTNFIRGDDKTTRHYEVRINLALDTGQYDQEMAQEDVLRVHGDVGLQLPLPPAVGFLAVLFTFAGVNFLNSAHAYGMPQAAAGGGSRVLAGFADVARPEALITSAFFLAYMVSFLLGLAAALWRTPGLLKFSVGLAALGLLGNTVVLIMRTLAAGRFSFTAGYDFSLWFVWGITLCALVATLRGQPLALLASLPLALMVAMYGYLYFADKSQSALVPALQNKFWLHLHVSLAILAYGALALAAGWGVIYLVKQAFQRRRSGSAAQAA